jgi:hypothetical protein
MQAHPDKSPEEITQALRYSAAQSNQPDSLYGYGIANIPAAYEYLELPDDAKPQFLNQNSRIVLYNGDATTINYDLFLHKRFLLIFKLKKKESSGTINNATPITHFPINPLDLKCSEKYTLRVKLSGGVENHALNKRLLYACPN